MKAPIVIKPFLLRASIGLVGFIILLTGRPTQAATLFVNTSVDESTGFNCSLREAVDAITQGRDANGCANSAFFEPYGTNDTINIAALKILLNGNNGGIIVSKDVTIQGQGYLQTIIDATGITSGSAIGVGFGQPFVTIRGLTIQNSKVTALGVYGGTVEFSYGRILNSGDLFGTAHGGCIYNQSNLYLESSELRGCKAQDGGGIDNSANFTFLYVYNTTIHECRAFEEGGAIFHDGGDAEIFNSTLANNVANIGGGFFTSTDASSSYLQGVTIAYNETLLSGAGALSFQNFNGSSPNLTILGSIVAKNINAAGQSANCRTLNGSIASQGFNILGDSNEAHCPGEISSGPNIDHYTNPNFVTNAGTYTFPDGKMLAKPSAAGGVGPVYVPNHGSLATSLVPPGDSLCFAGSFDERSVNRVKDGNSNCDIGAASRSSALFVVANPGALSAGDTVVKNTLTGLGFDVTMGDGNTVTSASASGKAIVVISNSVARTNLKNVPATFRDVPAGVLVMDPSLYGPMMMTGSTSGIDFGSANGQTSVTMDNTDPFSGGAFGFLAGNRGAFVPVTQSQQTYGWGVPAADGFFEDGADLSNFQTRSALFSFSAGNQMAGGFFAPGTRVGFFASEATANVLTAHGKRLLQEAILRTAQGVLGE
jgi:hypothetical protein